MELNLTKETRDQALHGGIATAICAMAALAHPISWALAGFMCGMIREVTEDEFDLEAGERKLDWKTLVGVFNTSKLDLAGWTLIPMVAGVFLL